MRNRSFNKHRAADVHMRIYFHPIYNYSAFVHLEHVGPLNEEMNSCTGRMWFYLLFDAAI